MTSEFVSSSEDETFAFAKKLGERLHGDELILLSGGLGAGKTLFAKGIAAGLGLKDIGEVHSPSYTLINVYEAKCTIYHVDLYRLDSDEDIEGLGWEDFLEQGVVIVEWANKYSFPQDALRIEIEITGTSSRLLRILAAEGTDDLNL